jgi:hypothetical protein
VGRPKKNAADKAAIVKTFRSTPAQWAAFEAVRVARGQSSVSDLVHALVEDAAAGVGGTHGREAVRFAILEVARASAGACTEGGLAGHADLVGFSGKAVHDVLNELLQEDVLRLDRSGHVVFPVLCRVCGEAKPVAELVAPDLCATCDQLEKTLVGALAEGKPRARADLVALAPEPPGRVHTALDDLCRVGSIVLLASGRVSIANRASGNGAPPTAKAPAPAYPWVLLDKGTGVAHVPVDGDTQRAVCGRSLKGYRVAVRDATTRACRSCDRMAGSTTSPGLRSALAGSRETENRSTEERVLAATQDRYRTVAEIVAVTSLEFDEVDRVARKLFRAGKLSHNRFGYASGPKAWASLRRSRGPTARPGKPTRGLPGTEPPAVPPRAKTLKEISPGRPGAKKGWTGRYAGLAKAARRSGVPLKTLRSRVDRGMTVDQAVAKGAARGSESSPRGQARKKGGQKSGRSAKPRSSSERSRGGASGAARPTAPGGVGRRGRKAAGSRQ